MSSSHPPLACLLVVLGAPWLAGCAPALAPAGDHPAAAGAASTPMPELGTVLVEPVALPADPHDDHDHGQHHTDPPEPDAPHHTPHPGEDAR